MLARTLSKDKDTFTISRPNIGTCGPDGIEDIVHCKFKPAELNNHYFNGTFYFLPIYSVMNGQLFSINNVQTVVFPGPGITLPSFRKPDSLPLIQVPRAFLLAARRIEMPSGQLHIIIFEQ